jgi:hypothetical protein
MRVRGLYLRSTQVKPPCLHNEVAGDWEDGRVSDAGVDVRAVAPAREFLKQHWWRLVVVLAAVAVAAFSWNEPFVGLFGLIPTLVWCGLLARTARSGVIVGLVLVALLAWFVVPREVGFAGPWVPAAIEVYWFHTVLAAVVCGIGMVVQRRPPAESMWLVTMVLVGFVVTGVVLFVQLEAVPGDEGVYPGPSQLQVVTKEGWCGSGNCSRILEASGDRAPAVMREYLASHGFTPRPAISGVPRVCRRTGILVTHEVCAELRDLSASAVRVEWYVN